MMQGGEVFIPRLPSMSVIDVVRALAPEAEIEFTGIKPGEKIHEELLSSNESRHTVALEDMLVIKPEFHTWGDLSMLEGKSLPDRFELRSDNNDTWLSAEELRKMVESLKETH